ncbi:DMT family transporter [Alicyclobacillus tolerans]|uniref:DMT family transporter n=1 Tax=Alicyclobacillus tolerans TaxID=90970 RepID=UPI001F3EE83D|nr:DMT family transporter [Alicyclobacillus tolerans]MCF8566108.1 DMT family transporter [Alicyclobacillus tolerans]
MNLLTSADRQSVAVHRIAAPFALLLSAVTWGLAPVANRYLVGFIPPLHLLFLRYVLTSLFFLPVLFRIRVRLTSREVVRLSLSGLIGIVAYNASVVFAAQWVPAETMGLVIGTEPLWMAVLAVLFLKQRLKKTVAFGMLLSAAGLVVLTQWASPSGTAHSHVNHLYLLGIGLLLFGALMWVTYSMVLRPLSHSHGALAASAFSTVMGTLPMVLLISHSLFVTIASLSAFAWLILVTWSILNAAAIWLWNYGLSWVNPVPAGLFLYLIPAIGVAGGHVLLHESLTTRILLGGALTVAGVIAANLPRSSKPGSSTSKAASAPSAADQGLSHQREL